MELVVCDLCGKAKTVAMVKRGALALCEHCAGLFGGSSPLAEDPGSLGAVAVANEASESGRCTLAAPRDPGSERPTLPVPAPRLDELVKNLDGQFTQTRPDMVARAAFQPATVEFLLQPRMRTSRPRPKRADASLWGKGIMASAGMTLAVMIAFLSLKATTPRAPGVPSALAHEEPTFVPPPIAHAVATDPIPSPPAEAAEPAKSAAAQNRPATAPPPARTPTETQPAPRRAPSLPAKLKTKSAEPAVPAVTKPADPPAPSEPPPPGAGPNPEFGGRD
jgi:hypothetical protein